MPAAERAQTHWREQFGAHFLDDGGPAFFLENRMAQRDGEDLIGPAGGIVALLAVDHVEEITALFGPETSIERFPRALCMPRVGIGFGIALFLAQPFLQEAHGIVPQRI